MTDLRYEVPADLDMAVVLSWFMLERDGSVDIDQDPAVLASPLVELARVAERRAVCVLQCIDCILSGFAVRVGAQILELCAAVDHGPDEPLRDITARMPEIDQRRMVLLGYGSSMASPFQLGPPGSLLPQLIDYMDLGRWR
jgi:hypothetical protein